MEDLSGRQLGKYRIIEPLGEGGMAAVFKALQQGEFTRTVALKILPRKLSQAENFTGRFLQEANILAQLQHPHILPIFDYGQDEGYTFLVMPLIDGGTLTDILAEAPLPYERVITYMRQLGRALDYAHSLGLVHRDIKPSNVLIDRGDNCLLSDFGIAKILENTSEFTATGSVIGTPAYMSPEQGRGEPLDHRSDIYSLGIILYEMMTGRVPFNAETPIAIIFKHVNDPLPMPRALNPVLTAAEEQVILRALAKRPEERYGSCRELIDDLARAHQTLSAPILKQAPSPAPPTEIVEEDGDGGRKLTGVWLTLIGLGLLVVIAAFLLLPGLLGGEPEGVGDALPPAGGDPPAVITVEVTLPVEGAIEEQPDPPSPTPSPPATDTPLPTRTVTPTAEPTITPTATPAVYLGQAGETVALVAPGLGLTAEELAVYNGLEQDAPVGGVTLQLPQPAELAAGWPVSDTGVPACHLVVGRPVVARENARLWSEPNVETGTTAAVLDEGIVMDLLEGPVWGAIRTDIDFSGWWWRVTAAAAPGSPTGWLWQGRVAGCNER